MSWFDDYEGPGSRRADDWYDTQQVCLNGHQITSHAESQPLARRAHCEACGAKTIEHCPNCKNIIRGYRHIDGVFHLSDDPPPKYCPDCGSAFPWHQAAIENLEEILRDEGLSQEDMAAVEGAIPHVVADTPKTESASLKLGRALSKLSKPAYAVAVKVVSDIASETAKKTLGLS